MEGLATVFPCKQFVFLVVALCLVLPTGQASAEERGNWWQFWSAEDERSQRVKILEPFLEIHTGPGRGFPVFYVAEQDEWITLEKRRTDWFKVTLENGESGWAKRNAMEKTMDAVGEIVRFTDPRVDDFTSRRWEAGVLTGDFDGASVNSLYMGYLMTANLSTELGVSQVLGDFSQNVLANINLVHQPFPHWTLSPFFTLGTGMVWIKPKSTLVREESRQEQSAHVGLGLRYYLADRYFLRVEYKDYVVFTDRDNNEEAKEWKLGLSVFF